MYAHVVIEPPAEIIEIDDEEDQMPKFKNDMEHPIVISDSEEEADGRYLLSENVSYLYHDRSASTADTL